MVLPVHSMAFVHAELRFFELEPLNGTLIVITCDRTPLLWENSLLVSDDVWLSIDIPYHQVVLSYFIALCLDIFLHIPNYDVVWVLSMLNNDADIHGLASCSKVVYMRPGLIWIDF